MVDVSINAYNLASCMRPFMGVASGIDSTRRKALLNLVLASNLACGGLSMHCGI